MSDLPNFENYLSAQQRAFEVMNKMDDFIRPGVTEQEIVDHCKSTLLKCGLEQTWYYNVPALVYVGNRTTLSMSGRLYQPTNTIVQPDDWVTIAISPIYNQCWGAMARTFMPAYAQHDIHQAQHKLHSSLVEFAKPEMSFNDLYERFNQLISELGYINLDYNHNLGHSLANDLSQRQFIEKDNKTLLKDCNLFALETHIANKGDYYGSKHENVYYFVGDQLKMLASE